MKTKKNEVCRLLITDFAGWTRRNRRNGFLTYLCREKPKVEIRVDGLVHSKVARIADNSFDTWKGPYTREVPRLLNGSCLNKRREDQRIAHGFSYGQLSYRRTLKGYYRTEAAH